MQQRCGPWLQLVDAMIAPLKLTVELVKLLHMASQLL
jgi:hypothetical protein